MTPQLSYIAELTQPSFVSLVIMKSTQRTSSSPSTLVHCYVMPVTHPLYQSSGMNLMTILGFEDLGLKKSLFFSEESDGFMGSELDDSCSDLFLWDSPAVCIDDLIVSTDSCSHFQTLGVPPLPKNRNAACGQHKEEILCQLRELVRWKPDPYGNADVDPANILQSLDADPQHRI
ncbi:hypothetical protein D5086_019121 [Populus alba]|uniref:Uncharacterized protein n=1 Tax=Populus alba TaxID=43335 RepID=A0ACC4BGD2_POPAL